MCGAFDPQRGGPNPSFHKLKVVSLYAATLKSKVGCNPHSVLSRSSYLGRSSYSYPIPLLLGMISTPDSISEVSTVKHLAFKSMCPTTNKQYVEYG